MPSIVDPRHGTGGGWTATRGLMALLKDILPLADLRILSPPNYRPLGHALRQLTCLLQEPISGIPATVRFNSHPSMAVALREADPARDLVILNGSDLIALHRHVPAGTPTLLILHNLEHHLLSARAGRWLPASVERLKRFELDGMRAVENVIFLSWSDWQACLDLPLKGLWLPPVFNPTVPLQGSRSGHRPGRRLRLGLLANMTWWPNRRAWRWFVCHVGRYLGEGVEVHLYGPGSRRASRLLPGCMGHGPMACLRAVWEGCDLMMAPGEVGAGVKIKVTEALCNGVPVVATPAAAAGVPPLAGLTVMAEAENWVSFLRSVAVRAFIEQGVPQATREIFTIQKARNPLQTYLQNVMGPKRVAPETLGGFPLDVP